MINIESISTLFWEYKECAFYLLTDHLILSLVSRDYLFDTSLVQNTFIHMQNRPGKGICSFLNKENLSSHE